MPVTATPVHFRRQGRTMSSANADERIALDLPASVLAPAAARQWVLDVLARWGLLSIAPDACLVVSELVTNAVRHAVGAETYSLELVRTDAGIRIGVGDPSPLLPVVREPDAEAPGGRGM